MFTKDDLDEYIRQQWAAKGFETGKEERVGISVGELVMHSAERSVSITLPYLNLWIKILDELVSWLISLLTVFYAERSKQVEGFTNFERSIITLVSKIISDSLAIRHIILMGYDVSARALLRSTVEYMEVLVAILHEPLLADEFVKTDDLNYAQKFWSRYIARKSIRSRIQAAWVNFFGDSNSEAATWFANWGHSAYDILSAASHVSFAEGLFSAVPLKTAYTDEKWLGIWGDPSESSVDTISIYACYMFPALLLSRKFPFKGCSEYLSSPLEYDAENELHRHVYHGADILASMILSLHKESNRKHVFPDLDTSIFGQ